MLNVKSSSSTSTSKKAGSAGQVRLRLLLSSAAQTHPAALNLFWLAWSLPSRLDWLDWWTLAYLPLLWPDWFHATFCLHNFLGCVDPITLSSVVYHFLAPRLVWLVSFAAPHTHTCCLVLFDRLAVTGLDSLNGLIDCCRASANDMSRPSFPQWYCLSCWLWRLHAAYLWLAWFIVLEYDLLPWLDSMHLT